MTLRFALPILAASLAGIGLMIGRTAAEPATRISGPIVHQNVAVYLLHGASAPGPVPQTLQEAMAKGTVTVHETGSVQELKIENTGEEPVFVQFGDIVKGGQQDRVLTVSMVLAPKSGQIPIGAYCVEQGRWSKRGLEDAKRFALSESLMPSREAKIAMVKPVAEAAAPRNRVEPADGARAQTQERPLPPVNVRPSRDQVQQRVAGAGDGASGQSGVWRSVSKVQEQLSAALAAPVASESSRTSLQLALEHEKLKQAQADFLAALEPAGLQDDDVIGVVVSVNGKLSGGDVYPSNGLFRKMWPKLARAAATEALSNRSDKPAPAAATAAPTLDAVNAFITEAEAGKSAERTLANAAKLETRDADKSYRIEARNPAGAWVHRNYLAK